MDVEDANELDTGYQVRVPASVVVEIAAQGVPDEQVVARVKVHGAVVPPLPPVELQSVVFANAIVDELAVRKAMLLKVRPLVVEKPVATAYWPSVISAGCVDE